MNTLDAILIVLWAAYGIAWLVVAILKIRGSK
jgi:hypothetical protein